MDKIKINIDIRDNSGISYPYIRINSYNYRYGDNISVNKDAMKKLNIKKIKREIKQNLKNIRKKIKYTQNNKYIENYIVQGQILLIIYDKLNHCKKIDNENFIYTFKSNSHEEFLKWMKENKKIQDVTVIYPFELELNKESVLLAEQLEAEYPNIKFKVKYNHDYTSSKDMKKANDIIEEKISRVKKFDYSPLEKALHAYDIVTERKFKQADDDEINPTNSRDLIKVLNSDNIVCVGFANMYCKMLQELGINAIVEHFSPEKIEASGHARVLAYIKDDKYDINGIYSFDPTTVTEDIEYNHLEHYSLFAKTFAITKKIDDVVGTNLNEKTIPSYNDEFINIPDNLLKDNLDSAEYENYSKTLESLSKLVFGEKLDKYKFSLFQSELTEKQIDEIRNFVNYAEKLRNNDISCKDFLNALIKVRRNEHIIDNSIPLINPKDYKKLITNSVFLDDLTDVEHYLIGECDYDVSEVLLEKYMSDRNDIGKKLIKVLKEYQKKTENRL